MDPQVHLSADTDLGPAEKLREPLEAQLTSALRAAVEKVDADYHGEDVESVSEELLTGTKDGLHPDIAEALTPNQRQLRSVAADIVDHNT